MLVEPPPYPKHGEAEAAASLAVEWVSKGLLVGDPCLLTLENPSKPPPHRLHTKTYLSLHGPLKVGVAGALFLADCEENGHLIALRRNLLGQEMFHGDTIYSRAAQLLGPEDMHEGKRRLRTLNALFRYGLHYARSLLHLPTALAEWATDEGDDFLEENPGIENTASLSAVTQNLWLQHILRRFANDDLEPPKEFW